MEEDPVIPQRMRDIARTELCDISKFEACGLEHGVSNLFKDKFIEWNMHLYNISDFLISFRRF